MNQELSCINPNMLIEDVNNLDEISSSNNHITSTEKNHSDSDGDNEIRYTKTNPKLKDLAESDSDTDKENDVRKINTMSSTHKSDSEDNNDRELFSNNKKSRIKNISNSDSESPLETDHTEITSKYDLTRTKIRNKELHDKFKKLKQPKSTSEKNTSHLATETSATEDSDSSSGTIFTSKKKQKLHKKSSHTLASICDPDTSDDETNVKVKLEKSKPRSTKLISPKAVRMSAKQAMENMQKIKSESNRMLREKEVSLPYHRPKALTLKDIMNRRKPALTSDGKSLPIKMNNEQLKQYALMLEQRQKEMMELCKSDTDEEEETCPEKQILNDKTKDNEGHSANETILNRDDFSLSEPNDTIYDDVNIEHNIHASTEYNFNDQNTKKIVDETKNNYEDTADNDHNCHKNDANEIENMPEKQEQKMETSVMHENSNLLDNDTNKSIINTTSLKNQPMDVYVLPQNNKLHLSKLNKDTEQESQIISLHYDSERGPKEIDLGINNDLENNILENSTPNDEMKKKKVNEFSDDDFTMEELEQIIEDAEVNKDTSNKVLPTIEVALDMKPTLAGTPGMVIDLDGDSDNTSKKLTGVELLKERFKYFAKLKSLEDMEKDREKKFKPGTQHLKLKQELEQQIAEQRSLEWEKRLQVENQLKAEMTTVEEFDGEDIEKIEAKLDENDVVDEDEEESSSDEEIEDTDVYDIKDKPRLRNPLIDDEADVSEDEDLKTDGDVECNDEAADQSEGDGENDDDVDDGESDSEDDDDSSQSEEETEQQTKRKKGRILKAFEDSDNEDSKTDPILDNAIKSKSHEICESQDEEIQLAQLQKTYSDDLFTSQESSPRPLHRTDESKVINTSLEDLGSQTFSILKSATENIIDKKDDSSEKLDVICETQPCTDDNFEAIVGMCTAGFSQNIVTPLVESSQLSQSQEIDDDMIELCAGNLNNGPFISQACNDNEHDNQNEDVDESNPEKQIDANNMDEKLDDSKPTKIPEGENKLLKSILEELDDPEFDSPKPNKYFFNADNNQDQEKEVNVENTQFKKKFVIESDDEMSESAAVTGKKKKRKKRKLENRALQISDDEEEYSEPEQEIYESEIEEDNDRLVEYDSEENEVQIKVKMPKKKRLGKDFFEQEAELTSEDEWIGSGDEDEAGLDRMEREEGDDETFHQGKLQRELGEIHMREVLDQDKREVRLLQELLFEDGDLGDGHRQRKFRWKNADGEEELGTNADEYADTQEDEFESEEQWRKQRHEREMFLRKLQDKDDEDANVTINRSSFIKAKLASKPTSDTASEKNNVSEKTNIENHKLQESSEKKAANSIPSPKKPFIILQQNYHNSLLTRGRGALARLAALATPLAGDGDDAPKVNASSNRGNFVFAAITPTDPESKVTKRKADTAPDTPRLLKKMKQESNKSSKISLFDHL